MPKQYTKIMQMIINAAKHVQPDFKFTSVQVNIGLTTGLNTDSSDTGPSLILAMGPHIGGQLWVHRAVEGQVSDVQRWQNMNGNLP